MYRYRITIGVPTLLISFFSLFFPLFLWGGTAQAASMTQTVLRLDRLKASTATGGTVCAKPATASTEADVQVTFPTGFTVNGTASNWTVTTTNLPLSATAWVGIGTATSVSSQTVTFPSGDLVVGTLYCFNFSGTTTLTTSSAGNDKTGTVVTRTSGPATIDTGSYALSIISNDQIVVSATVPATFTFSLGGNTDSLGTLSSSSISSSSGVTATMATNAGSGWAAWVKSANAALSSVAAGASIATAGSVDGTPSDLDSVTGYVLDVDATTQGSSGSGNFTVEPEYDGDTTQGGTLSTSFQLVALSDNPAGPTDGDVMTLIERAKISAVQAAATDYTDTLTVIAAGVF